MPHTKTHKKNTGKVSSLAFDSLSTVKPSSAWSSVNERPKAKRTKGSTPKGVAAIRKGRSANATKIDTESYSKAAKPTMAPKETLTKKPTMSPKETVAKKPTMAPKETVAKKPTMAPKETMKLVAGRMTKVKVSGGRGGAMSSSDIESMRKGYPTNIISSGGRGTMGNTPKKVAAIRAGRLANVSKKDVIKSTTPAKTKSISTRGSADISKKDTPSLRKTSVDTESYSGASRPKPGFEFNDNTAPKPLNKAGGTKNTPDGFSQFMANLTGVDVTPDLGTDIKGKKRKAVTAKNKTGGAFFGMFK